MSSFFDCGACAKLGEKNILIKLDKIIDWERLRKHLKHLHKNDITPENGGQKPYDPLKMLKSLVLGQWYSLSDTDLEESLRVRLDFMVFTGFEMLDDVPDSTTLCRFRNKLISKKLYKELLLEINKQLEETGIKVKEASCAIVDATLISSCNRPRKILNPIPEDRQEDNVIENKDHEKVVVKYEQKESKDPDAKWLKKGNKSYFGYKGFIRTEEEGFIENVHVTSANVSETKEFKEIIKKTSAKRILADKGYASADNREYLQQCGYRDGIMHKRTKNKQLSHWERIKNKLISAKRFVVEQTFGTLKRRFFFNRASYKSKKKVEYQLCFKAICINLLKSIRKVKFHYEII